MLSKHLNTSNSSLSISDILFFPGLFLFDDVLLFEVKKDIFSPFFIDFKVVLSEFKLRNFILHSLLNICKPPYDYVVGLESGGSYYASAISDILGTPLLYFRSNPKLYGLRKEIVGLNPKTNSRILIVDDVIATGKSVEKCLSFFKNTSSEITVVSIFSYGFDNEISNKYGVTIKSLIKYEEFIYTCLSNNFISNKTVSKMDERVQGFKKVILEN